MIQLKSSNMFIFDILLVLLIVKGDCTSLNCTFDDDFCYWVQDGSDNSDWTRHTGDASFIYIEKSYYSSGEEEIARLLSSKQSPGPFCLTFFYIFEIRFLGVLKVYMRIDGEGDNLIFTRDSAMESHGLRKAVISDFSDAAFQIVIEGVIDYGRLRGKISIDGITMTDRFCSVVSDCYFDSGLCNWMQDYNDDFDWTLRRDGLYIYINTSTAKRNVTARLTSPFIEAGKYCFSFLYHMCGKDTCTIRINKAEQKKETTEIVVISGSQETKWKKRTIFIQSGTYFKVIIEGRFEDVLPFQGYIAIADVEITSCQGTFSTDCENPLTSYGRANSSNFQYGSAVEVQCHSGYHLIGPTTLICQSGGIWSANVTCKPIDCENPQPRNGRTNSSNFRYGSAIEVMCHSGYYLRGPSILICQLGGIWSATVTCDPIECKDPTPKHGIINSTSFHYGSAAEITCNDGFKISGKSVIHCKENGNWTAYPTCMHIELMNSSDLTCVYVTVPLIGVALAIAVTAFVCRKKIIRYFAIRSQPGNVKKEHLYENQSDQHGDLSQGVEDMVIAHERHEIGQGETIGYSTIADAASTTLMEIQHSYNNTKANRVQVIDNVIKQTKGATKDCNHGYAQSLGETSEYYTLGPQVVGEKHYSVLMRDDNDIKANNGATSNEYEQPVGPTPEYFVL